MRQGTKLKGEEKMKIQPRSYNSVDIELEDGTSLQITESVFADGSKLHLCAGEGHIMSIAQNIGGALHWETKVTDRWLNLTIKQGNP